MTSDASDGRLPRYWEWKACGASVTGSQHLSRGLGCDDAFGYATVEDFVVGVVADGAGSVSGTSAWGAFAACQAVLRMSTSNRFIAGFRKTPGSRAEPLMRWLFEKALDGVTRQAESMNLPVNYLATTLSVALATPRLAVFGQIGDGVIASHAEGLISTHLIEQKDDYANATWFIQSDGAFEESFRTAVQIHPTALALSTDGMSYKITNIATGDPYEPFFSGSWQHLGSGATGADLAALLRGIEDDQTGDDKTLVLAVLQQADDLFHPSARPLSKLVVSSAVPPNPELVASAETVVHRRRSSTESAFGSRSATDRHEQEPDNDRRVNDSSTRRHWLPRRRNHRESRSVGDGAGNE